MVARRAAAWIALALCLAVAATAGAGGRKVRKGKRIHRTASGLQYEELRVGTGGRPASGQVVVVHYTGWLADGTKIDSSIERNQPFEFKLGSGMVIKGFDEGIASMRLHGKRKLIIPPELGYGERGAGSVVPASSTLVFEVELLEIR